MYFRFPLGYKRIWHSGGITTYKSMVWLYPDVDIGIYLSANGPPSSSGTWGLILALYYLSDVLLNEQRWLNTSTLCGFPEPWASPVPDYRFQWPQGRVSRVADYLGTYRHPGYFDIVVTYDARIETLQLRMGRYLEAKLLYNQSTETFYTQFVGKLWYVSEPIPVRFTRLTPEGQIVQLHIPFYSPYDTAKPVVFSKTSSTPSKMSATNDGCLADSGSPAAWSVAACWIVKCLSAFILEL